MTANSPKLRNVEAPLKSKVLAEAAGKIKEMKVRNFTFLTFAEAKK